MRLQMTVDELQDQLRLAKAEGSGKAAADCQLLQQQLHAVEAAYAELREEMVSPCAWGGGGGVTSQLAWGSVLTTLLRVVLCRAL
jgi:hypothetical protein